jgi:hypothetical protein
MRAAWVSGATERIEVTCMVAKSDTQHERQGSTHAATMQEQMERNQEVIRVLDSFLEGDAEEQRETWEYLKRVLDEDRPSDQKLFP